MARAFSRPQPKPDRRNCNGFLLPVLWCAYAKGASKVRYPNGKHNKAPSLAVDIAPYPIDWSNNAKALERFVYVAGFVMCTARRLGVKVRWGGDWSPDDDMRNEGSFRDYPHFELAE